MLVVRDTSKAGSVRGASAIRDDADAVIVAQGPSEGFAISTRHEGGGKMNNAPNLREVGFCRLPVAPSAVISRAGVKIEPRIVAVNEVLDRAGDHSIREFLVAYGEDTNAASKRVKRYLGEFTERGLATASGATSKRTWTRFMDVHVQVRTPGIPGFPGVLTCSSHTWTTARLA